MRRLSDPDESIAVGHHLGTAVRYTIGGDWGAFGWPMNPSCIAAIPRRVIAEAGGSERDTECRLVRIRTLPCLQSLGTSSTRRARIGSVIVSQTCTVTPRAVQD